MMKKFFVLLVFAFSLGACAPAKVRFAPGVIPSPGTPSQEDMSLGFQINKELLSNAKIVNAPQYRKRVEYIVSRLLRVTPSQAHWRVFIVQSPEWNAMTTPGNFIYVFTGIMDSLRNDEELAAVLAHEISHQLAQHSQPSTDEQLGKLLVLIAGVAVGASMEDDGASQQDINDMVGLTTEVTKGFALNPYSQAKEKEADLIGMFLMADAGFDPQKATKIWFDKSQQGSQSLSFFNTHPASNERYEFLRSNLELAQERYRKAVSKGAASKHLNSLPSPHTPSLQAYNYYLQGLSYFQNYNFDAAIQTLRAANRLDPKYAEPLSLLGVAQIKQGLLDPALETFRKAVSTDKNNSNAHYNLACTYALKGQSAMAIKSLRVAFQLEPSLIETAKQDGDLFSLHKLPEFNTLFKNLSRSSFSINSY